MHASVHEKYASDLLQTITDGDLSGVRFGFIPRRKSRHASGAMTAILCQRILRNSGKEPTQKASTTFEWKEGTFNCRNIADREYLWTNMRRPRRSFHRPESQFRQRIFSHVPRLQIRHVLMFGPFQNLFFSLSCSASNPTKGSTHCYGSQCVRSRREPENTSIWRPSVPYRHLQVAAWISDGRSG